MASIYDDPDWTLWSNTCAKFARDHGKTILTERDVLECYVLSGILLDCEQEWYG